MKQFTRDQVIQITTAVMKSVCSQIDVPDDDLDHVVDVVSATVVKTLLEMGVQLPWLRNLRTN